MGYFGPLGVLIGGFYLSSRLSAVGALITGLVAGVVLSWLAFLEGGLPKASLLAIWVSPALGTIPVFFLANRFNTIKSHLLIVPLGSLLILAGGPIKVILMLLE